MAGRPDVAWLLGCLVLLFATSSGLGRYMPAMFSMHMAAHMLLSMLDADPAGARRAGDTGVAGVACGGSR